MKPHTTRKPQKGKTKPQTKSDFHEYMVGKPYFKAHNIDSPDTLRIAKRMGIKTDNKEVK